MELKSKITRTFDNSDEKGYLRAFADVTIGNEYVIHGVKVMDGSKGLFVQMPATKGKNSEGKDEYYDTFNPIAKESREAFNKCVIESYQAFIEKQSDKERSGAEVEV